MWGCVCVQSAEQSKLSSCQNVMKYWYFHLTMIIILSSEQKKMLNITFLVTVHRTGRMVTQKNNQLLFFSFTVFSEMWLFRFLYLRLER